MTNTEKKLSEILYQLGRSADIYQEENDVDYDENPYYTKLGDIAEYDAELNDEDMDFSGDSISFARHIADVTKVDKKTLLSLVKKRLKGVEMLMAGGSVKNSLIKKWHNYVDKYNTNVETEMFEELMYQTCDAYGYEDDSEENDKLAYEIIDTLKRKEVSKSEKKKWFNSYLSDIKMMAGGNTNSATAQFESYVDYLESGVATNTQIKKFDNVMRSYLGQNFDFNKYISTGGGGSTAKNLITAIRNKKVSIPNIVTELKKVGAKKMMAGGGIDSFGFNYEIGGL